MNDLYFNNVVQVGNLYLEHIFYDFETEPILFSCVDEKKRLYLCLCTDIRYGQKWVVVPCSITVLRALINEEIDIVSAFFKSSRIITIIMDLYGNESSFITDINKIDRLDLPKEGTFIKCNKTKAEDYLRSKECEAFSKQFSPSVTCRLLALNTNQVPG